MIQDIFPHKLYNQYDAEAVVTECDTVLNIYSGKILVQTKEFGENRLKFPKKKDFDAAGLRDTQGDKENDGHRDEQRDKERDEQSDTQLYTYLFTVDRERYFLLPGQLETDRLPEGYDYVEERSMRREGIGPDENMFAAVTGRHLADWYRDTQFCGRCGHRMVHSAKERAMTCEACKYTAYPRIMPAVIVGVKNGDSLLLTKYRTGFGHNALIAGFTEIGETAEETVAREVMEEAGVRVKNIRYYKSQPWGTANDLLLGFYCELDGDPTITMDSGELKYAEWVKREDIVLQPGSFSMTNEMMRRFKLGEER